MGGELVKASLAIETGGKIDCLYNPETLVVNRNNSWAPKDRVAGQGVPEMQFNGATSARLNLTLLFDTTSTGKPVTDYTDRVLKLMELDPNLAGSAPKIQGRPPTVMFNWGSYSSFPAVVESAVVTFDYFSAGAVPLRATVVLGLVQFSDPAEKPKQNPTSGTPRPGRVHRVQPGETLDRISARYYGDATRWRILASANGLEDPLALRPGALLDVPRLDS